ncbi:uncharacterized protein IUM83_12364 [Phytophthora cinnamomi]|uniref:uncharacterized protein n=1 Tax=Phytophthora cinnamomi TaxID=4785 RepID=UPI00355961BF|nr:hypothetical protein IUM83_12364 [Phytophthora cinnamomi]
MPGLGEDHHRCDDEYEKTEEVDERVKSTAAFLSEVEALLLQVSRMGYPRPVECSLAAELNPSVGEDENDDDQVFDQRPLFQEQPGTPGANKVVSRLGEEMRTRSEWMIMFAPVTMVQDRADSAIQQHHPGPTRQGHGIAAEGDGLSLQEPVQQLDLLRWDIRRAESELTHWKRRLRAEFGLERAPVAKQTTVERIADFGENEAELGEDTWSDRGDPGDRGFEPSSREGAYSGFSDVDSDKIQNYVAAGAVSNQTSEWGNSAERRRATAQLADMSRLSASARSAEMTLVTDGPMTAKIV